MLPDSPGCLSLSYWASTSCKGQWTYQHGEVVLWGTIKLCFPYFPKVSKESQYSQTHSYGQQQTLGEEESGKNCCHTEWSVNLLTWNSYSYFTSVPNTALSHFCTHPHSPFLADVQLNLQKSSWSQALMNLQKFSARNCCHPCTTHTFCTLWHDVSSRQKMKVDPLLSWNGLWNKSTFSSVTALTYPSWRNKVV